MPSVQVGLRLPPNLHEKMMDYAGQIGASKSEVIMSALVHYLEFAPDTPLTQRIDQLEQRMAEIETLLKKEE